MTTPLFMLSGHTRQILVLFAHPYLPILVSGSSDGTVRVWDLESRCCLRVLEGHAHFVTSLAIDPAGRRVVSGSSDHTVKLWDLETGSCLHTLANRWMNRVHAVAWDATGTLVASGSDDHGVRIWDAASGKLQRLLRGHSLSVNSLVSHPSDDFFASGSLDSNVHVWRWSSGEHVFKLKGHMGAVKSLVASPEWLVTGSEDQTAHVRSWASGRCVRVLEDFEGQLHRNSLAWRGSSLATLESDGTVRVWDTSSSNPRTWSSCTRSLASKVSSARGLAIVGDGRVAYAAPDDWTTIVVWDVTNE